MADTMPLSGPAFGTIDTGASPPVLPTQWQASETRLKREESTRPSDYLQSMLRQDGIIDGAMGALVGSQFQPQQGYFVGSDSDYEGLKKDLWPEHIAELYKAVSPTHAVYLKGRLMDKQTDMVRLGDLGVPGTIGRFAMGLLAPDNLVWALTGGWAARGVQMARNAGLSQTGKALASAEARAAAGKAPAVAAGIALGAAENTAYEALRQAVNFEDSNLQLAEAFLFGGAFTAPFAFAGARRAGTMQAAAEREVATLRAFKKVEDGQELAPHEAKILRETVEVNAAMRDLEAGRIDEATFDARVDKALAIEPTPAGRVADGAAGVVERPADASPGTFARTLKERKAANDEILKDTARQQEVSDLWQALRTTKAESPAPTAAARQVSAALDLEDPRIVAAKAEAEAPPPVEGAAPPAPDVPAVPAAVAVPEPLEQIPPADSFVGREVSFQHKDGSTIEGKVTGISPATGRLIVEDTYTGRKVSVAHTEVDQYVPMSEAPEGFLPGSIGAAQISKIADVATQRTAMAKMRFDYFAILNGSTNEQVRELSFRLVKDAIQVDGKVAQAWTASEYKKHLQRTIGGDFHRRLGEAFSRAVELGGIGPLQRGKFQDLFMELVSRETRGDWTVKANHKAIHPAIAEGAKAMRDAYARALEEMQRAGVLGADAVPANDLYVNRQWRFDKIRDAIAKHGEDRVVALLARSINVPGHIGDLDKARRFLNTVRKLEYSTAAQNIALQPRDMATLRSELAQHGLTPDEVNDLVDVMFDARAAASSADSGQMGHLKFRFDIDETMAENGPNGVLRIQDLFENDARALIDTYLNSVGGHVGLAKAGIRSSADWQVALKAIQEEPGAMNDPKLGKELEYLEDLHRNITGRPMSTADFSYTARVAQAVRGLTRSITLGQLGITAAFEMHKAMAMFGVRAMLQGMPSFAGFLRALRKGYIPEKGLAEDIMMMTGFGNEMAASYARALELEGGFAGGTVSRWEHWANKASHVTDILSGNASFTSMTRHLSAMGATRQAFEVATGARKLTAAEKRRWVGQGVSDNPAVVNGQALPGTSDLEAMLGGLKDHAVVGPDGRLEGIRFEDWQANDRGSYETFQLFLSRQVRDAIQDHDIGETMPWMHTVIGKMFAELKTFMLVAHAKNFAKNLEYRDATSLNLLMVGMLSESLAYSLQTAVNFPDELDKRLTAERIAQAVASRMSMGGFSSVIAATGYHVLTGGDPLFGDGITANTDTRLAFKPPSAVTMQKLINAPATLSGLLGTDVTTQREARDLLTMLPGSRLIGVPATIRYLTEGLPKTDPEKP